VLLPLVELRDEVFEDPPHSLLVLAEVLKPDVARVLGDEDGLVQELADGEQEVIHATVSVELNLPERSPVDADRRDAVDPQRQLLLCTGDNYFCATSVFKQ
jgi:hypothetical protein